MIPEVMKGFIVLSLIFIPLERLLALRPQLILRHGWGMDTVYYFSGYFIGRAGAFVSAWIALVGLSRSIRPDLQDWVAAQPVGMQFLAAVVIAEVGYYTAHRLLHTVQLIQIFRHKVLLSNSK